MSVSRVPVESICALKQCGSRRSASASGRYSGPPPLKVLFMDATRPAEEKKIMKSADSGVSLERNPSKSHAKSVL